MTEPEQETEVCAPLCGASKAYGPFDKPWKHELECPVRLAWERQRIEEPIVRDWGRLYRVEQPVLGKCNYAIVKVDGHDDYCDLHEFYWNGLRGPKQGGYRLSELHDKEIWDAMQEVWDWLAEWELVELKPIGPEDSEYFATERLKAG